MLKSVDVLIGLSVVMLVVSMAVTLWYRDADGNFIWAGGTDAPHPTT